MQDATRAQLTFLILWTVVTAIKILIAARLPLFVDEAFYWQEGRHLAAAYSDLPGLTAWMTRLGTELGGQHVLALRGPFLLLAALLPWLIAHIGSRWFGEAAGWRAGSLALLMPLAGSLGVLALPDVPMAFATVLCLDAGARLLREIDAASAAELALGLTIGALSHYRFIGVIGVGVVALLLLPQGRKVLRDPRIWVALAVGIAAWAPLIAWNLENSDAGLRFQLVDRHPWSFQAAGLWFLVVQAALVTPLLFFALMQVFVRSFRNDQGMPAQWRYFGLLGGVSTVGFFALGFFADVERVSFHWPLPGYLPLLIAVPALMREWPRGWRIATWLSSGAGLLIVLAYYLVLSTPQWRERFAAEKYYPANFAGWDALAAAVRQEQARLPAGTRLLANSFKSGAELGFALGDPRIPVLDHPLNHKHGRAPQLALWGLTSDGSRDTPVLLVVGSGDVQFKSLLEYYQLLCKQVGPLPAPRVVNVDHGHQRFLLFALPAERPAGACTLPAFAWIDTPESEAGASGRFQISGWAFKDGAGLEGVDILLDGAPVARAHYGTPSPGTAAYWKVSTDPNHPNVGFRAEVDVTSVAAGRHWLGLRLHGSDGSVEDWAEQPIEVR
ncbi:glycosyltransferase family 39 protein [Pseudoxanthomonas gei]|uniref:Glycosyltransferase family 39 protein n=1 Tax=Pseudoxanthomonas gei TaxID=1383030 RepID=A0ABX0AEQ4_9GAMM|nr:glycosyltransferase family 39 protein [Pseudoxanthomonas gei]NDK37719.1 glycosyltransferase family 39 protein [Pseudoxanthomonas gei]